MAIDALVGLATSLFAAAPEEAAAAGAIGAADVGGAIALPEIAVTAAAPEIAGGAAAAGLGADVGLGALGGDLAAAGLVGGAGAGAAELGLAGAGAADLTGGAIGAGAPVGTEGVTSIGEQFGTAATGGLTSVTPTAGPALGSSAAGGVPADVLQGTTSPLQALNTGSPSTFDELWQSSGAAGLPPSTDISAQIGGDTAQSFAGTTEPIFSMDPSSAAFPGAVSDAFASPGGAAAADTAFAGAPLPTAGAATGDTAQTLESLAAGVDPTLNTLPGGAAQALAGEPVTAPTAATALSQAPSVAATPASLTIPAATGGVTPGADVAASQAVGSTAAPGSLTTAGGGGVSPGLGSILSGSNLRTAALLAPVAGLGLTLARGQPSLPPAEEQALAAAQQEQAFGHSQLTAAQNNQITPAQAAQISTYVQNATNQLYQFYAAQGRNPQQDTDFIQGVQQINQNAIAMQQQFINAMITNGLAATGQADSTLQAAANLQVANDAAFQQALTSSISSFGLVAALSASTAPKA